MKFSSFRLRPERKTVNIISSCKRSKKKKDTYIQPPKMPPHKNLETYHPLRWATLRLAEHMKVVSLRRLLSDLLFRKSPAINLGLYHTALYGINVPKVELLAKIQKVCFFGTNPALMECPRS